jgi:hypothetical protein
VIELALIQIFAADETLIGIVGKASQICVAGDNEPRPYPKLVIDVVGTKYINHAEGTLRMRARNVKVHAWAKTPQQADALANAVEDALENYSGVAGGMAISAVLLRERRPREQSAGAVVGVTESLHCQTITMDINASKVA